MVFTSNVGPGTGFTATLHHHPRRRPLSRTRWSPRWARRPPTAPLSGAGAWVMQMAAFKAAVLERRHAGRRPRRRTWSATAASMSQINLTWTAATDNVAVTSYLVERCAGRRLLELRADRHRRRRRRSTTPGCCRRPRYSYRVRASDAAEQPRAVLEHRQRDHAGGHAGADRAVEPDRDADLGDADQPRLDARRPTTSASPAISSSAARAPAARPSRRSPRAADVVQRHRPHRADQLQLPRARHRRGEQPRPVLGRRDARRRRSST